VETGLRLRRDLSAAVREMTSDMDVDFVRRKQIQIRLT
jgi:hypothetical protein